MRIILSVVLYGIAALLAIFILTRIRHRKFGTADAIALLAVVASVLVQANLGSLGVSNGTAGNSPSPPSQKFPLQSAIVGRWRFARFENGEPPPLPGGLGSARPDTVVFFDDGTVEQNVVLTMNGQDFSQHGSGTYRFIQANQIRFETKTGDQTSTMTLEVAIESDELKLKNPSGWIEVYARSN